MSYDFKMEEKRPKIGIVGLGPVGSILSAHLGQHGEKIIAEDIASELLLTIKQKGLRVSGLKNLNVRIGETANSISELASFKPDIIFIATKACILNRILPEIKQIIRPEMVLVSFQNGIGNEQLIVDTLGIETTYRVVVNYAGNSLSHGHVSMNWFQPPNYIGAYHKGDYTTDKTSKRIAEMLTTSGLRTEEVSDVKKQVWEKTILNSALCSICAVTGQTMQEAIEFQQTSELAVQMLEEGLKVARADGYNFGEGALDRFVSYLRKGGAHKPSMLVDIENRKPTEVDFMSGAMVRYGEVYKIPTPVNSTFTGLLKALEDQYLPPEKLPSRETQRT